MAIAYFHISSDAFDNLTPIEFDEALKVYHKKTTQEVELKSQLMYEVARFVVLHIWSAAGKSLKSRIQDMKKAFPFPWDKKIPKKQTGAEIKSTMMDIINSFPKK